MLQLCFLYACTSLLQPLAQTCFPVAATQASCPTSHTTTPCPVPPSPHHTPRHTHRPSTTCLAAASPSPTWRATAAASACTAGPPCPHSARGPRGTAGTVSGRVKGARVGWGEGGGGVLTESLFQMLIRIHGLPMLLHMSLDIFRLEHRRWYHGYKSLATAVVLGGTLRLHPCAAATAGHHQSPGSCSSLVRDQPVACQSFTVCLWPVMHFAPCSLLLPPPRVWPGAGAAGRQNLRLPAHHVLWAVGPQRPCPCSAGAQLCV
jgi:hypothetical protein